MCDFADRMELQVLIFGSFKVDFFLSRNQIELVGYSSVVLEKGCVGHTLTDVVHVGEGMGGAAVDDITVRLC